MNRLKHQGSVSAPKCLEETLDFEFLLKHFDIKYEIAILKNKIKIDNRCPIRLFNKWISSYIDSKFDRTIAHTKILNILLDLRLIRIERYSTMFCSIGSNDKSDVYLLWREDEVTKT